MHSGHEERMDGMDGAIQDVRKNIRLLATGQQEIRERLARDERDIESALRMIRDQEAHTRAITKMGLAIEHMAEQVKDLVVIIKEVDGRVVSLERIPNEEIKELIEGVRGRVEALERAPGEEMVALAKQAKRKTVDMITAAVVGAAIAALTVIPYVIKLLEGVGK